MNNELENFTEDEVLKFYSDFVAIEDMDIALPYLLGYPSLFSYLNPVLKSNKELIQKVLEVDGLIYEHLDSDIKLDRDLALIATTQNGKILDLLPEEFLCDKQFVLAALSSQGQSYKDLPKKWKNDVELMFLAANTIKSQLVESLSEHMRPELEFYLQAELHVCLLPHLPKKIVKDIGDKNIFSYLEKLVLYKKLHSNIENKETSLNKKKL